MEIRPEMAMQWLSKAADIPARWNVRPEPDIKTDRQKTPDFPFSRRRASSDSPQILHGNRGGLYKFPVIHTLLDLMHSLATRGRQKLG